METYWPLQQSVIIFLASALVIGVAGVMITSRAELLARYTGWGQAVLGAVFVGASTSLSGSVTSVAAAYTGHTDLAIGNALGGIAVQTMFLAIADIAYRKANLEHAAASQDNLMQGSLLIVLLALVTLAMAGPEVTFWGVHPVSLVLIVAYVYGINLVAEAHEQPMWFPRRTTETAPEPGPQRVGRRSLMLLWLTFIALGLLVAGAGWAISRAGVSIAEHSGLSETVVGTLFTAVSTSLPELVVAVAAVRRGALRLAVGDIIGGNTFDVLILTLADVAYRGGSIYHALSTVHVFWIALSILLTGILLMGLLRREEHGIGNIGFESFLVLVFYAMAVVVLVNS